MSLWIATTGTQTATTGTENTLAFASTNNAFQFSVDTTNMANGDVTELRIYRIINASSRQETCGIYANVQADPLKRFGPFAMGGASTGVKTTLKQTAGTGREYDYELLADSGTIPVNVTQYLGTAVTTATGGIPDINVKNINNVVAATPGAAGGIFIAGTNAATVVTGSLTTTFTGSLTGTVASVSGSVASVSGSVASVSGSVASVSGSVASVTGTVGTVVTIASPQTLSITGNITGNLTGSVGNVAGNVGNVSGTVGGNILGNVSGSVASVAGNVGNVSGTVGGNVLGSVVGNVANVSGTVGGNILGSVVGSVGTVAAAVTVGSVAGSASNIKKGQALSAYSFIMTGTADHAPSTGLTVTGSVSINGAAFVALTNAVSEISSGWYAVDLAAADTNGNTLGLRFTATGADDRGITLITQP